VNFVGVIGTATIVLKDLIFRLGLGLVSEALLLCLVTGSLRITKPNKLTINDDKDRLLLIESHS